MVASRVEAEERAQRAQFQSPSLRGSGRFRRLVVLSCTGCNVSIPFIAGQWSLQIEYNGSSRNFAKFQSPSLRGSGRFWRLVVVDEERFSFQSPSLRGSGRFLGEVRLGARCSPVSIPFIAGQWSLLHDPDLRGVKLSLVSIPFIAGQWSLLATSYANSL